MVSTAACYLGGPGLKSVQDFQGCLEQLCRNVEVKRMAFQVTLLLVIYQSFGK